MSTPTHFDVIIIGAGISGIGSAYHLQQQCPEKKFLVLEGMESFGGTWLIHKYPGIRSDSDLYTFGYRFKPWTGSPIASGEQILNYMNEVIEEANLAPHIRYNHQVLNADWNDTTRLWTLTVTNKTSGDTLSFTTNFLWMNQGYYEHEKGYIPQWDNMDAYQGDIIHPQNWPEDLDYKDKNIVVIGSGATAATIAPNIAKAVKKVTILQRSPTYFFPRKNENEMADTLRALEVEESVVHDIVRRSILKEQKDFIDLAQHYPDAVKQGLIDGVAACLPEDFDVKTHFTPSYNPWRQRIAVVPDGDIFTGIKAGKADIVTDTIDKFTEKGILLNSGKELQADIILSATGFNLSVLGGIQFSRNGELIDFAKCVTYRGMMFTGIPNMVWVMGYFRASWTLRVDLLGDYVCRLLKHMDEKHVKQVTVTLREQDKDMTLLPWIDTDEFNPGYMLRSMHLLPKRGSNIEWQHTQDYWEEKTILPNIDLDDDVFIYR